MGASIRPRWTKDAPPARTRSGELPAPREDVAALLAHDLKTPLAAISMNLDFVLSELPHGQADVTRSALEDCRAANLRAIRIVTDMADAVLLTTGERTAVVTEVDVQPLLAGAVARAAPEAASRGIRLVWSADAAVLRADGHLLERVLDQLMDRALRHARSYGSVDVTLRDGAIVIRVRCAASNDVDVSSPDTAARALAVYFAQAAMRAQGGAMWTEVDDGGALLFCLTLPR